MINITVEIDGAPVAEGDVVGAVERAAIEGIRRNLQQKLEEGMSAEELAQLGVKLVGSGITSLVCNLSGPSEIILKARAVLERGEK